LFLGIWVAIHFSWWVCGYLGSWFNISSKYLPLTGFAVTFLLIVILVHLLARALTKSSSKVALGGINKVAGMLLGACKVLIIFGVLIVLMNHFDPKGQLLNDEVKRESLIYVPLNNTVVAIYPSVEEKMGAWKLPEMPEGNVKVNVEVE
jgi:membrane protein required for colicin V production